MWRGDNFRDTTTPAAPACTGGTRGVPAGGIFFFFFFGFWGFWQRTRSLRGGLSWLEPCSRCSIPASMGSGRPPQAGEQPADAPMGSAAPGATRPGREAAAPSALTLPPVTAASPLREPALRGISEWLPPPRARLPPARPISGRAAGPPPAPGPLLKAQCHRQPFPSAARTARADSSVPKPWGDLQLCAHLRGRQEAQTHLQG